jgi:hypothetical protein
VPELPAAMAPESSSCGNPFATCHTRLGAESTPRCRLPRGQGASDTSAGLLARDVDHPWTVPPQPGSAIVISGRSRPPHQVRGDQRAAVVPRGTGRARPRATIIGMTILRVLTVGGEEFSVRRARRADVPDMVGLLADDPLGRDREGAEQSAYDAAFSEIDASGEQLLACLTASSGAVVGTLQLTFIRGLSRGGALRGQLEAVRVPARAGTAGRAGCSSSGRSTNAGPGAVSWYSSRRTAPASTRTGSTNAWDSSAPTAGSNSDWPCPDSRSMTPGGAGQAGRRERPVPRNPKVVRLGPSVAYASAEDVAGKRCRVELGAARGSIRDGAQRIDARGRRQLG